MTLFYEGDVVIEVNGEYGEYIGGIWVPADPMDLLQCDSCQ